MDQKEFNKLLEQSDFYKEISALILSIDSNITELERKIIFLNSKIEKDN